MKYFFRLLPYMKVYQNHTMLTVVAGCLHYLSEIAMGGTAAYMISLAVQGSFGSIRHTFFFVLGGLVVLRVVMYYAEMWYAHEVAFKILADFRIRLYQNMERISPAFLLGTRDGQLSATLMSDVEVLEWFFAHTAGTALIAGIVPAIVLGVMAQWSGTLALIMLAFIVLAMTIPFVLKRYADTQGSALRDRMGDLNAETTEGIQALREITMLNYKDGYIAKLRRSMKMVNNADVAYGKRLGLEGAILLIVSGLASICVMIVAASMVFRGVLAFEWFSVCVVVTLNSFSPVLALSNMARKFGIILAACKRVFLVLEEKPTVEDRGTGAAPTELKQGIAFDEVSFRYKKDAPCAVEKVSFRIEPGQTLALVGHSGAGKSTCASLLMRYWNTGLGSIKLEGVDIRDYSLASLRGVISAVLQESYLFNISIRENIKIGNPDASDEAVELAAKLALVDEFVDKLPQGCDTVVGERGMQLSGGQRQRIVIARAILKNAPILILDEAVANLDVENEALIQKALENLRQDRTIMVIAHRLSTITAADRLVVLENGRVVQTGTHGELIRQDGVYRNLVFPDLSAGTAN